MKVVSKGELRAIGVRWQPRAGAFALTVIAKATFDLQPVLSPLAEQQEEPNEDDNHWDDDRARSVYAPSDAAPFKAGADVVLVGDAFAPHRSSVRSLVARLVVGGVDKSIEVFGTRAYSTNGVPHEPVPFAKMSLRYERASTGEGGENPVGLAPDHPQAPNLVRPGASIVRGQVIEPVGFGPIAPSWPGRAHLLARAGSWTPDRIATAPVPEQLSSAFFNVAPPDQQVARLATDEHIVLENLSLDHPLLVTNLPGIGARAFAARAGDLEEVKLAPDTLWIDATRALATLTFRGQLALTERDEEGTVFVLTEVSRRPLTWSEVKRVCEDPARQSSPVASLPSIDGTIDSAEFATNVRNALPFVARPRQAPSPVVAARIVTKEQELPRLVDLIDREGTATELPNGLADASPPWLAGPASTRGAVSQVVAPIPATPPPSVPPPIQVVPPVAQVPPPARVAPLPISPPAPVGPLPPAPASTRPSAPTDPGSVLAASNAAAQTKASIDAPNGELRAEPTPARTGATARDLIELLWFDEAILEPLRKVDRYKALIASFQPKKARVVYDDDQPPDEPAADRDRRDVFGVVSLAPTQTPDEIEAMIDTMAGDRGMFTPPLATVSGELSFPFDEVETLRATMTSVAPFATGDKKLKELTDTVNELLKTPWLRGSGAVAESMLQRVREAFAAQNRGLPPGHLDAHTERILLAERQFQRRTVFGAPHLRALFTTSPSASATIAYLPEALANKLPMYQRLRVRMLVEAHSAQDQLETSTLSLRCVAFARLTSPTRRK